MKISFLIFIVLVNNKCTVRLAKSNRKNKDSLSLLVLLIIFIHLELNMVTVKTKIAIVAAMLNYSS